MSLFQSGDFVVQATESSTPQQAAFLGNGAGNHGHESDSLGKEDEARAAESGRRSRDQSHHKSDSSIVSRRQHANHAMEPNDMSCIGH